MTRKRAVVLLPFASVREVDGADIQAVHLFRRIPELLKPMILLVLTSRSLIQVVYNLLEFVVVKASVVVFIVFFQDLLYRCLKAKSLETVRELREIDVTIIVDVIPDRKSRHTKFL